MASWNELTNYIRANYKVHNDDGSIMSMVFDTGQGRSQVVIIALAKNPNTGEEWAHVASAIGGVGAVNLEAAARQVNEYLCGGIVVIGDYVYVQHAVPLANLDTNEFVRPLSIVVDSADSLEQVLTGRDDH